MNKQEAKKTANSILAFIDFSKLPKVKCRNGRGGETRKQFRDKLIRAFETDASLELVENKLTITKRGRCFDLSDIIPIF